MKLTEMFGGFFKSRFNIYLTAGLLLVGFLVFFQPVESDGLSGNDTIYFFYLPTCTHCAEQKPVISEIADERPDLNIIWMDASSREGSDKFYQLALESELDTSNLGVPALFIGGHVLVGFHTKDQILTMLEECGPVCEAGRILESGDHPLDYGKYELPLLGRTDLTQYSLPVLAVVLGLIDGFNPCAMWVLMYLIGLLMGVKDRVRIWVIVGSFVLSSGILYFLFMTAWINMFILVGYVRILTLAIGLFALGSGILNLKEFIQTKGALVCSVGGTASHQKTMDRIKNIISEPLSFAILVSIIGLAFVVNSIEFVCSSAIPAVFTQVLALSGISAFSYYSYIMLYTFFFMLDDLIIFGMAVFTMGSTFGQKYAKYCKLIGGIIMTVLGALLVFAPGALS